ncbi:developmental pluripotency-associated protein 3 [Desmodus rotundus]|uniref:developmental pluripotency-associated protein 3 n=1 Tax=Desmodus rotundus TaxID=9430 RepID=UPI00238150B4|nr:developmental pluripotency-associated protein 3 [Desmodus rotundus]
MDSPKKLNPTWTLDLESSQSSDEECSADPQAVSEVLAKNLRSLTLNPSTKPPSQLPKSTPKKQERRKILQGPGLGLNQDTVYKRRQGVRTVETVRKERMRRMLQMIRYRTLSLLQKSPQERKLELESLSRRFRCPCHYCRYHADPSDSIRMENSYMENGYDME